MAQGANDVRSLVSRQEWQDLRQSRGIRCVNQLGKRRIVGLVKDFRLLVGSEEFVDGEVLFVAQIAHRRGNVRRMVLVDNVPNLTGVGTVQSCPNLLGQLLKIALDSQRSMSMPELISHRDSVALRLGVIARSPPPHRPTTGHPLLWKQAQPQEI